MLSQHHTCSASEVVASTGGAAGASTGAGGGTFSVTGCAGSSVGVSLRVRSRESVVELSVGVAVVPSDVAPVSVAELSVDVLELLPVGALELLSVGVLELAAATSCMHSISGKRGGIDFLYACNPWYAQRN